MLAKLLNCKGTPPPVRLTEFLFLESGLSTLALLLAVGKPAGIDWANELRAEVPAGLREPFG